MFKNGHEAFDLPEAYLLALIQLESGGRKPAGKRFEAHVHNRLVAVRDGKRERYEQITAAGFGREQATKPCAT